MDFIAHRGEAFSESFDFKNKKGKAIQLPTGTFVVNLERGDTVMQFTVENYGLVKRRSQVIWQMPAAVTKDFAYNTMYYTLYLDDTELSRGVLMVQ